jgi:hypothetical protein
MNARRRRPRLSARLLLLAVLLLTQGLLLAHEIDHLGTSDTGLCAVCQAGHGLDSPAVASPAPPPPARIDSIEFDAPAIGNPKDRRHAGQARAPPRTLRT